MTNDNVTRGIATDMPFRGKRKYWRWSWAQPETGVGRGGLRRKGPNIEAEGREWGWGSWGFTGHQKALNMLVLLHTFASTTEDGGRPLSPPGHGMPSVGQGIVEFLYTVYTVTILTETS